MRNHLKRPNKSEKAVFRDGSRAAATCKMERSVLFITKRSILDVTAVLDPPLVFVLLKFVNAQSYLFILKIYNLNMLSRVQILF